MEQADAQVQKGTLFERVDNLTVPVVLPTEIEAGAQVKEAISEAREAFPTRKAGIAFAGATIVLGIEQKRVDIEATVAAPS